MPRTKLKKWRFLTGRRKRWRAFGCKQDKRDLKGEEWDDRKDMQKEAAPERCTLLNGSACSTEKKYMQRYRDTFDIFFRIEHRMRKEKMEEQFNREAKQGWRFAADAERESLTNQQPVKAASIRREESSWQLTAIWGSNRKRRRSDQVHPWNEGRIAQAWVNVR